MNFPDVVRGDSLALQVYNAIRLRIREGAIPCDHFFSESEFGTSMGVSRTPVREALLALFREGLVEIVPKRGFRLVDLNDDDIAEIRLLRVALEKLVVERLCIRATPKDVESLRNMLAEQRDSKSHIFELDEAFHLRMATLAGLPETGRLLLGVRGKMYLIASGTRVPAIRTDQVLLEHIRIVDTIERRDVHVAQRVIAEHIDRSIDSFLAARSSRETNQRSPLKTKTARLRSL